MCIRDRNRRGPRTLPWVTPAVICLSEERAWFILTRKLRSAESCRSNERSNLGEGLLRPVQKIPAKWFFSHPRQQGCTLLRPRLSTVSPLHWLSLSIAIVLMHRSLVFCYKTCQKSSVHRLQTWTVVLNTHVCSCLLPCRCQWMRYILYCSPRSFIRCHAHNSSSQQFPRSAWIVSSTRSRGCQKSLQLLAFDYVVFRLWKFLLSETYWPILQKLFSSNVTTFLSHPSLEYA